MILFFLFLTLLSLAGVLVFIAAGHTAWNRILGLNLAASLGVLAIVLWAVHTGLAMFLDIAIAFALLGFMDVQFFAVYLRKKGDFRWPERSGKQSRESDLS